MWLNEGSLGEEVILDILREPKGLKHKSPNKREAGDSKITVGGDCSHEVKRRLLFGRKAMTKLDSILKSRDITLPSKVHIVKVMIFPVVMYRCEIWTIKKAEHWRIDAFKLWCWRRLLRVPWTTRKSNQSILKEINPEYSLEGLMLKLKPQYLGHLMQRVDSLEKTPMLGKTEVRRRRGWQRMRWFTDSMNRKLSKLQETVKTGEPGMLQSMGLWRARHNLATRQQQMREWMWIVFTIREWRHRMEAEAREERGTTAGFENGGRDREPRNVGSLENVQKTIKWVLP